MGDTFTWAIHAPQLTPLNGEAQPRKWDRSSHNPSKEWGIVAKRSRNDPSTNHINPTRRVGADPTPAMDKGIIAVLQV